MRAADPLLRSALEASLGSGSGNDLLKWSRRVFASHGVHAADFMARRAEMCGASQWLGR